MAGIEAVTLKEAQFILERPQAELARAIDRGEVEKLTEVSLEPSAPLKKRRRSAVRGRARRGGSRIFGYQPPRTIRRTIRKLGQAELVYLALEKQVRSDLTPAGRRKLYQAIKALRPGVATVKIGPITFEVNPVVDRIAQRYRLLKAVRAGIVERADSDPVLKGTDISVYVIAALSQGQSVAEIVEDYPGLGRDQVRQAIDFAAAYPKPGRPYPTRSFKRTAAALASSGLLDVEPDDEPLSPHMFE